MFGAKIKLSLLVLSVRVSERVKVGMRDGQPGENGAGLARCRMNPRGPLAHLHPGGPLDTQPLNS